MRPNDRRVKLLLIIVIIIVIVIIIIIIIGLTSEFQIAHLMSRHEPYGEMYVV